MANLLRNISKNINKIMQKKLNIDIKQYDMLKIEDALELQIKYDRGDVNAMSFINNCALRENFHAHENYFIYLILLTQWNWKALSTIFGARSFQYQGEFLYDVWAINYAGLTIVIFTADEKGTAYEVLFDEDKTIDDVMDDVQLGEKLYCFWLQLSNEIEKSDPDTYNKLKLIHNG